METKQLIEQMNREWNELKSVLTGEAKAQADRFGAALGDTQAKMTEISTRIGALEIAAQRPVNVMSSEEKTSAAREFAVKRLRRAGLSQADALDRIEKHTDALNTYLRKGAQHLTGDQIKLMTVQDDTQGGFGASPDFEAGIIKGVVEISPARSLVTVRNTSKRSIKVMKRTGTFAAVWVGETETRSETTGLSYGLEEIPTHELSAMVDVSRQDLEDTDFDLEGELRSEFAEQFAYAEGVAVFTGNGFKKPEGIMANAAVGTSVQGTGGASALLYAGLVNVSHEGKEQYLANSRFIMNLRTLGQVRLIVEATTGAPIWAPMAAGAPATILGSPYSIVQAMDNVAADAFPVAYGDFKRAYRLADRISIEIIRDEVTQAASGAVRFWARKRLGGQVVLAEAVRKLKISVA
jgi:HK97 family phage major capsid protein